MSHWPELAYRKAFQTGAPDRIVLVVEEGGALRAFVIARFGGDECEVENIVVAESHRRRGLAKQLLQSLVAAARERKTTSILLEVRESNVPARALYEKSGFSMSGLRKSYYNGPTEDAVLYTLML